MRILTTSMAVCLVSSCCLIVRADDKSEAMTAFEEGKTFFRAGNYAEAADSFRKANRLKPNWKLLYNIGQSEAAAKRYGLALEAFEEYLVRGGDEAPEERQQWVQKEVSRLRGMIGSLMVIAPDGAVVMVDGVERGRIPLSGSIKIAAAVDHEVQINSGKQNMVTRTVKVSGGEQISVVASEDEAVVKTDEDDQPMPEEQSDRDPLWIPGWVTLGAGAAMLGIGVGTGVKMKSLDDALTNDDCFDAGNCIEQYPDDVDQRDNLQIATIVFLSAGGAAAVAGAVMLILAKKRSDHDQSEQLAILPFSNADLVGIAFNGRF